MKETNTAAVTGNSNKRKSYSSTKLWARRAKRRNEALDRNEKYEAMPILEKLKYVRSLGGCKKQLARLEAQYSKLNVKPTAPVTAPVAPSEIVKKPAKNKAAKKA